MKPNKSDFPLFVNFSLNIEDRLINPHIEDAYKYDVKPKLDSLASDIYEYEYSLETKPELKAFFDNFILQWWILLAYKRFIQNHGRNVTQFGYTKTKDPQGTFEQLDPNERSVILKQLEHDYNVCFNYILQETWTFDSITYRKRGEDCNKPISGSYGINALV